jgi:competence protein ComGC
VKPQCSNQRNHALTLTDVLVVAMLVLLAVLLLPVLKTANRRPNTVSCAGNVKQIYVSSRVWADDHNGKYPMEISTAKGGTMELAATGDVVATFQVMSNELSTPKVLRCPVDTQHTMTNNFGSSLTAKNVSYFIGLDASTNSPQAFLCGDDNFEIGGVPVKSGLLELPANSPVSWTSGRHTTYKRHFWDLATSFGNVGLADGSVQQTAISSRTNLVERSTGTLTTSLTSLLRATGIATNRLAIP